MSPRDSLQKIKEGIECLVESPLYKYRKKNNYFSVAGQGSESASIMFIGEAPGKKEAETGKPFCGASGKILDELLLSINLDRKTVYVTNIVKDRPPENRDPKPNEVSIYGPFLDRQINIIKPKVIATLGRHSMDYIFNKYGLDKEVKIISKIHGKSFKVKTLYGEVVVVALYHPAVALYSRKKFPEMKKDIKTLVKYL